MADWKIEGQYFETCNCDFVCPCISSNLTARPTQGDCKAPIAMKIEKGRKDGVKLDGLAFIILLLAPGEMSKGDITLGLIVDDKADDDQTKAIAAIVSGEAGGPMAGLAPLVSKMAGIEKRPIRFERDGLRYAVKAGELIDQACEGVPSPAVPGEPIYLDNTCHPVNKRIALAKATRSHVHAFGVNWDDMSGTRNGHFAPFSWSA
jgi:hypothetical protein